MGITRKELNEIRRLNDPPKTVLRCLELLYLILKAGSTSSKARPDWETQVLLLLLLLLLLMVSDVAAFGFLCHFSHPRIAYPCSLLFPLPLFVSLPASLPLPFTCPASEYNAHPIGKTLNPQPATLHSQP